MAGGGDSTDELKLCSHHGHVKARVKLAGGRAVLSGRRQSVKLAEETPPSGMLQVNGGDF